MISKTLLSFPIRSNKKGYVVLEGRDTAFQVDLLSPVLEVHAHKQPQHRRTPAETLLCLHTGGGCRHFQSPLYQKRKVFSDTN